MLFNNDIKIMINKIIGNTEMYNSDNGMYNQLREKREKLLIEKYHNN